MLLYLDVCQKQYSGQRTCCLSVIDRLSFIVMSLTIILLQNVYTCTSCCASMRPLNFLAAFYCFEPVPCIFTHVAQQTEQVQWQRPGLVAVGRWTRSSGQVRWPWADEPGVAMGRRCGHQVHTYYMYLEATTLLFYPVQLFVLSECYIAH